MDLNTFVWLLSIGLFVSVTPYIFLYLYKHSHKKPKYESKFIYYNCNSLDDCNKLIKEKFHVE